MYIISSETFPTDRGLHRPRSTLRVILCKQQYIYAIKKTVQVCLRRLYACVPSLSELINEESLNHFSHHDCKLNARVRSVCYTAIPLYDADGRFVAERLRHRTYTTGRNN